MALPPALLSLWTALVAPFTDPASRTWWGALLVSAVLAAVYGLWKRPGWTWAGARALLRHPSTRLDVQLLLGRQLLSLLRGASGLGGAWLLATALVRALDGHFGAPELSAPPAALLTAVYSLSLFVAWDLSRFWLHRLMHRWPVLWAFHQVHHSAQRLSPLSFHRIHPVESALYQLRGALVTGLVSGLFFYLFRGAASDLTLLGVPAIGLLLNLSTGNIRHSELWLPFPRAVEGWLLSPAQHQLHHSVEDAHLDCNYGTWLALWDRLGGSLMRADRPPRAFGLAAGTRNHGDDLLSAWVGPVLAAGRLLLRRPGTGVVAALLLLPTARAAEADDAPPDEDFGEGMVVYSADGTPRVAGSAQVVDEAALEAFEYNDIERVLTQVPGISTRGEDGFGLRPNIGIRGANSDRSAKITLMEDGVLLAPAPYAAPAAYYFPMTTRMTAVEVFKGPAATRFGPHTVGGAINMRTRSVPERADHMVDLSGGMYQSAKLHAWGGAQGDHVGGLVEGVHLRSGGFKTLDTGGPTGFGRTELMGKGKLRVGSANSVQLKLGYAQERSNETYTGLSARDYAADPYRRYAATQLGLMQWDRSQAELSWTAEPSNDLKIRTVAYHHFLTRAWRKFDGFAGGPDLHDLLQADPSTGQGAVYLDILRGEEDSASPEQLLDIVTNDRRFHAFGLQSTLLWDLDGDRVGSSLEAGLRLHQDLVHRTHTLRPHAMTDGRLVREGGPAVVLTNSDAMARALAAHLHEDLRLDKLHVIPGLRVETVQTTYQEVGEAAEALQTRVTPLPSVGALYEITPWVDVFAGSYRGFSPVAPGQDPGVLPELSWNSEAGFRLDQGERHAELVGFFNDYQNLTGQCTLSGGCDVAQVDQQFNGGAVQVYGLESTAGLVILLPGGLSIPLDASYTWTESRFQTGFVSGFDQFGTVEIGDSLPYVARHQASARAGLSAQKADLTLGAAWRDGMLDAAGRFPVTEADIPPLFLLDASVRVQATRRLELYAVGTNLTASQAITSWRPMGARPTAPLTVMVGLKLRPPERAGG